MKKENFKQFLKVQLGISVTVIIIYILYVTLHYLFRGHGDTLSSIGLNFIQGLPDTFKILVTLIGSWGIVTLSGWNARARLKKDNPDITDDQHIEFVKRINKLEYNLSLREKTNVDLLEKIGILTDQLSKSKKEFDTYKKRIRKLLLKQSKINEEMLFDEGD